MKRTRVTIDNFDNKEVVVVRSIYNKLSIEDRRVILDKLEYWIITEKEILNYYENA